MYIKKKTDSFLSVFLIAIFVRNMLAFVLTF